MCKHCREVSSDVLTHPRQPHPIDTVICCIVQRQSYSQQGGSDFCDKKLLKETVESATNICTLIHVSYLYLQLGPGPE